MFWSVGGVKLTRVVCLLAVTIVIIIIAVPSGIAVAKKKNGDSASEDGLGLGKGGESNRLDKIDRASIPVSFLGVEGMITLLMLAG